MHIIEVTMILLNIELKKNQGLRIQYMARERERSRVKNPKGQQWRNKSERTYASSGMVGKIREGRLGQLFSLRPWTSGIIDCQPMICG